MPTHKPIKAYAVVLEELDNDIFDFNFRTEERAIDFVGRQKAVIVPIIIKEII